ncbi:MAG: hypothetical protein KGY56_15070, partial [Desulfobacterales bacterium]|nr:hypothetical protein [Desulfobacterales bacterium]
YRQSKLAMILFTFDLAAQLKDSGITANCLHPATLMPTNMVLETDYFAGSIDEVSQGPKQWNTWPNLQRSTTSPARILTGKPVPSPCPRLPIRRPSGSFGN